MSKRKTNHRAEEEVDIAARGKNPKILPKIIKKEVDVIKVESPAAVDPAEYEEIPTTSHNFIMDIIRCNNGPISQPKYDEHGKEIPKEVYIGHLNPRWLDWRKDRVWMSNPDKEKMMDTYTNFSVAQITKLIKKLDVLTLVQIQLPDVLVNLVEHPEEGKELREKLMSCEIEWIHLRMFTNYDLALGLLNLFAPTIKIRMDLVAAPMMSDASFLKIMPRLHAILNAYEENSLSLEELDSFLKNRYMVYAHVKVRGKFILDKYLEEWKRGEREITSWFITNMESDAEIPEHTWEDVSREKNNDTILVIDSEKEVRITVDAKIE